MTTTLKTAAARFANWAQQDALPLWYQTAGDATGGFFEDLTMDGVPRKDEIRRVRVQPRQAYVYAHAHMLGWAECGQAASDHGFDYMMEKATGTSATDGSFAGIAHRLHADGSVSDPKRDTYDHAFVLLACAWRFDAFGDTEARKTAAACLRYLDQTMGQPDGSFLEGDPASLPRRQNPHMHLFEAFMALARATGDAAYTGRARRIFALFETHFFDARNGVLLEFFNQDWSLNADKGDIIEPGHMVEWVWLLDQYQELTGTDVSAYMTPLYDNAIRLGTDAKSGFLVDAISMTPGKAIPATRRTWVQTEYIKSSLVMARRGRPELATKAAELIDMLFATYLNTEVQGGYIDQFGADGKMISTVMPTSTLYHLISAAAEAKKTVEALG
ncbi:AGE family epimerase/isomerase [Parvularcula sp. LCG005]|uniref:AGE family epimerase/isomerase n=1 Tax=Parvularcula sp. LCG005 TaxID=3078805 RepID=UPI002943CAE9|nr:AGE family epimerase/isomerase [Parvularcula sp. LCG005]WOI52853.1 AGE family epimerase/isomerase [Parvularcula sp. LCG005]